MHMMCQQSEYVWFIFFFPLTEEECGEGGRKVEKPFSPPPFVKPAGKCSPAAAALEQKGAEAAWGGSRCCSPRRVSTQDNSPRASWQRGQVGREEAAGELPPSKHLGFIVLGVRPTSWKSLGRPRELLWGARTRTGIGPAAPLGALGLQQGETLILVLGLQTGKLSPCFLSV